MKQFHRLTFILLAIGGLNWLMVALFGWDIGIWLGGQNTLAAKIVYILVGLSAVYELTTHQSNCKLCDQDNRVKELPQKSQEHSPKPQAPIHKPQEPHTAPTMQPPQSKPAAQQTLQPLSGARAQDGHAEPPSAAMKQM